MTLPLKGIAEFNPKGLPLKITGLCQRDEMEVLMRTIENLEIEQSVIQKRLDRKRERLATLRREC